MKAKHILNEDNWWADKAKRIGLGIAGTVSSTAKGAGKARARAQELVTAYKEAIGQGLGNSPKELYSWLKQGDSPVDDNMIRQAIKKSGINTKAATLSMADARDFFVSLAGEEARQSGSASPDFKQSNKARQSGKASKGVGGLDAATIDAIASAVLQKIQNK